MDCEGGKRWRARNDSNSETEISSLQSSNPTKLNASPLPYKFNGPHSLHALPTHTKLNFLFPQN